MRLVATPSSRILENFKAARKETKGNKKISEETVIKTFLKLMQTTASQIQKT